MRESFPERCYEISTTHTDDVARVRELIDEVAREGLDGWVEYASVCVVYRGGHATTTPVGAPLAAEFGRDDLSFSLRRDGDAWLWVRVARVAEGTRCRTESARLLSTEPGLSLRYEVLWRRDEADAAAPVHPWRPWLSRFQGWESSPATEAS